MPLKWKREENPYRTNYFGILELGANARRGEISATRKKIVSKLQHGTPHVVGKHEVTEAEINEAEARLLDEPSWIAEALLVHPVPATDNTRLPQICRTVLEQTTPPPSPRVLRLANLPALAPLLPVPCPEDVAWPTWEEFHIPGPGAIEDRQYDVQFDI